MDWGAIGDWFGQLQAGTWTEFAASILTAGSLLLGFSILTRDRRLGRQAQARRIALWYVRDGAQASALNIKNVSDQPISGLTVSTRPRYWWETSVLYKIFTRVTKEDETCRLYQYTVFKEPDLPPDQEWRNSFPLQYSQLHYHRIVLRFVDAAGMSHRVDVGFRRSHRFLRRRSHLGDAFFQSLDYMRLVEVRKRHGGPQLTIEEGFEYLLKNGKWQESPPRVAEPEIEPLDGRGTE